MAKKTTKLFTYKSEEIQGEGSFVTMRKPSWGMMRKATAEIEGKSEQEAGLAMMNDLLPGLITAWNWTDVEGELLPLPKDRPEVIDDLEVEEVMFLVEKASQLLATEKPGKN